jgi:hypothetical protein
LTHGQIRKESSTDLVSAGVRYGVRLSCADGDRASVGFYASTFDPPSRSQIRMIRCALGDDSLHKECAEIGKSVSRLIVLVIEDSEKDNFASAREQILMLKRALKKHGDRVEIVASTTAQAEQRKRALLEDKNLERLFQLVSADAYKDLKLSRGGQDPKLAWLVFPLEAKSSSSKAGAEGDPLGLMDVVEKLGLYHDVSPDLTTLQRSLFEEGWNDFLKDLKTACPVMYLRQSRRLAVCWPLKGAYSQTG